MNWDYIAGFLDGEGSIILKPPRVRIYLSNTDKKVLDEIYKFLNCGAIREVKRIDKNNWKTQYLWTICAHDESLRILKNLRNRLITKKDKCEEAIKYIENKRWHGDYISKNELEKFKHLSCRKIAKEIGVSHYCVFRYLKKYNLR